MKKVRFFKNLVWIEVYVGLIILLTLVMGLGSIIVSLEMGHIVVKPLIIPAVLAFLLIPLSVIFLRIMEFSSEGVSILIGNILIKSVKWVEVSDLHIYNYRRDKFASFATLKRFSINFHYTDRVEEALLYFADEKIKKMIIDPQSKSFYADQLNKK